MIDSHAHIGAWGDWRSDPGELYRFLEKRGVEKAIVSDLAGNGITSAAQEIEVNENAFSAIRPYADRMRLAYYLHPSADTPEAETLRLFDTGAFVCFKVYPKTARKTLLDAAYARCFALAETLGVPVCCHTESDGFNDVRFAIEAAKRYPRVNIVAVHAGFRTDHEEAFMAASELANFFTDTTLLHVNDVMRGVSVCGASKILFGTDALAISEDMCARYDGLYDSLALRFGEAAAKMVCAENAERLFPWRELS